MSLMDRIEAGFEVVEEEVGPVKGFVVIYFHEDTEDASFDGDGCDEAHAFIRELKDEKGLIQ